MRMIFDWLWHELTTILYDHPIDSKFWSAKNKLAHHGGLRNMLKMLCLVSIWIQDFAVFIEKVWSVNLFSIWAAIQWCEMCVGWWLEGIKFLFNQSFVCFWNLCTNMCTKSFSTFFSLLFFLRPPKIALGGLLSSKLVNLINTFNSSQGERHEQNHHFLLFNFYLLSFWLLCQRFEYVFLSNNRFLFISCAQSFD